MFQEGLDMNSESFERYQRAGLIKVEIEPSPAITKKSIYFSIKYNWTAHITKRKIKIKKPIHT